MTSSSRFIWPASAGIASTLVSPLTVTPSKRTDACTGKPVGMALANSPGKQAEMASVRQIACASVCARVTVRKFGKRALMPTVRPASFNAQRVSAQELGLATIIFIGSDLSNSFQDLLIIEGDGLRSRRAVGHGGDMIAHRTI